MIRPAPILVSAAAAWTALVVAAPVIGWPAVYAAAHLVCHQIPERSFHVPAGPLAVCARCLGLYAGALVGGVVALARGGRGDVEVPRAPLRQPRRARRLAALAALPILATLVAEWVLRWPVTNPVRFAAALPLGAVAAWLVVSALEVDWRT